MLEKLKNLLRAVNLLREVRNADVPAERLGLKRAGKSLLAAVLVAACQFLLAQTGPDCGLGPDTCKVLTDPMVGQLLIAPALQGLEKYANERFGLGLQALDTVKRG